MTRPRHQFSTDLRAVFHEHALLLVVVGAYFVSVAAFFLVTGLREFWIIRWFYPSLALMFVVWSTAWLLVSRAARRVDHVAGATLVALIAAPFQSTFNSVKQVIDNAYGYRWDATFAEADRWLHFGRHPWEWLEPVVAHRGLIRFIDLCYMLWFPIVIGFVIWAAWSGDRALRRRALVAVALVWVLCGNVAALAFSSAGPCYYDAVVTGHDPFARLMVILDGHHEGSFLFARSNQTGLWNAMQSNAWLPFGGVSAMPSVHVAMAVLIALIAGARNGTAGMILTMFALMTMLGSVVLGWHYAIDGYLGALMAYAIWRAVIGRARPASLFSNRSHCRDPYRSARAAH